MKKNILFFVMLILMTDLFAEQVIQSYIRNDWPDNRYAEHDDGTVTDRRTGLMWKKCSEGQIYKSNSCSGITTTHNWKAALEIAQKSSFAGYSDWRLPNIKELFSLAARDRSNPSINITIFPNIPSSDGGIFWSSSPYTYNSNNLWLLGFYYGGYDKFGARHGSAYVRLVRLGQ